MDTDIRVMEARKDETPSALGVAIFAGGFSLGMEQAGFNVLGHCEFDDLQIGVPTARRRWPVHVGNAADLAAAVKGIKPDVLYMNPPCVAFAGTGKHLGCGDARMKFLGDCVYAIAMPSGVDVWAWELVPGVFSDARDYLDAMAFRASRAGYRCYAFLTSSALHGGFQDRRRFHFIASKYELDFDWTYATESEDRRGVKTLGDALHEVEHARACALLDEYGPKAGPSSMNQTMVGKILPNDQNVYHGAFQSIFPYCPPGSHLGDLPDEIMALHYRPRGHAWRPGDGRPGFSHTRGRADKPSPNVLGGHTIIHPVEDRYLTPREAAHIMGYPDDMPLGDGTKAYSDAGRGLCTHNARFVGKVIMGALNRRIPATPTHELKVIDWRDRVRSLSLTMTRAEQADWYRRRHGDPVPAMLGCRNRARAPTEACDGQA